MDFADYVGIEAVGCGLAILVIIQLGLELRSIFQSDLASRGDAFLQVQGRYQKSKLETESPQPKPAIEERAQYGP